MAKTLGKETVAAIELAVRNAKKLSRHPDLHAIAEEHKTTYQSVSYIRRRIERLELTGIDVRKKSGRKPHPEQDAMAQSIRDLLLRHPELDQSAVSDHLEKEFGVRLCQASISRIYKTHGILHKVSNRLYRKSQLFAAQPDGQVVKVPRAEKSKELAERALSSLTGTRAAYKSPYQPILPGMVVAAASPLSSSESTPSSNIVDMSFTGMLE